MKTMLAAGVLIALVGGANTARADEFYLPQALIDAWR